MNKLHSQSYIFWKIWALDWVRNETIQQFSDSVLQWSHFKKRKCFCAVTLLPPNHGQLSLRWKSESQPYNLEKSELGVLSSTPFQNQCEALPTFILKLPREWSMATGRWWIQDIFFLQKNSPPQSPLITDTLRLSSLLSLWIKKKNGLKKVWKNVKRELFELNHIASSWHEPNKELRKKEEIEWVQVFVQPFKISVI